MTELQALRQALDALRRGELATHRFCEQARGATALLQRLPPRFGEVLGQLLDRLESGALFSEESCSFSQRELLDQVQLWIDKAEGRLAG